ncbi:MAG: ABC transporter ATP-binding protein [Myxococcota bacterium]
MPAVVQVRGLRFAYGEAFELSIDDVTIGPGVFGLLGPNGAGKSTWMSLMCGLLRAGSGTVHVGGQVMSPDASDLRARVALMPQDFGLFPGYDVAGCLTYYGTLRGMAASEVKQRLDELSRLLDLNALFAIRVEHLSGGQRQKVGLAMAMLGQPEFLLVDEPTAGLDPIERDRVLAVLHDYGERATVVLSTHIVEDVEACCERAAIVMGGRVVASGNIDALRTRLAGRLWMRPERPSPSTGERARDTNARPRLLRAGRFWEWAVSDASPGAEWHPLEADLRATFLHLLHVENGAKDALALAFDAPGMAAHRSAEDEAVNTVEGDG